MQRQTPLRRGEAHKGCGRPQKTGGGPPWRGPNARAPASEAARAGDRRLAERVSLKRFTAVTAAARATAFAAAAGASGVLHQKEPQFLLKQQGLCGCRNIRGRDSCICANRSRNAWCRRSRSSGRRNSSGGSSTGGETTCCCSCCLCCLFAATAGIKGGSKCSSNDGSSSTSNSSSGLIRCSFRSDSRCIHKGNRTRAGGSSGVKWSRMGWLEDARRNLLRRGSPSFRVGGKLLSPEETASQQQQQQQQQGVEAARARALAAIEQEAQQEEAAATKRQQRQGWLPFLFGSREAPEPEPSKQKKVPLLFDK
ncbi:hypothetical protein ACSSS7_000242 [Eimeria intestinalis]